MWIPDEVDRIGDATVTFDVVELASDGRSAVSNGGD